VGEGKILEEKQEQAARWSAGQKPMACLGQAGDGEKVQRKERSEDEETRGGVGGVVPTVGVIEG
jgi:hypothetical protein